MKLITKKKWKSDIRKIFPKLKPSVPAGFVKTHDQEILIATSENEVVYIRGKDLERLLQMIPWDEKLDPIRKLMAETWKNE